jgi:cell division septation protein DedD
MPPPMPYYQSPPAPRVNSIWVIPGIPNPNSNRCYQLQVGAFTAYEAAAQAFHLLRTAGFNAAYEQMGNVYRVFAAGVPAQTVQYAVQRMGMMGFSQVWIRE